MRWFESLRWGRRSWGWRIGPRLACSGVSLLSFTFFFLVLVLPSTCDRGRLAVVFDFPAVVIRLENALVEGRTSTLGLWKEDVSSEISKYTRCSWWECWLFKGLLSTNDSNEYLPTLKRAFLRYLWVSVLLRVGVEHLDGVDVLWVPVDLAGVTLGVTTTSSLFSMTIRDLVIHEKEGMLSAQNGVISSLRHK